MSWTLWGLVALLVAAPFLGEWRRKPLGAAERARASGDFADLARGRTHYRWFGPDDGPVVVCIHGLTTAAYVWGPVARGLAAAGYRVLTYDLYGRGFSDRPRGAQDAAFFLAQLDELLADQGVTGRVTLLGYSMGGAIATAFAAAHPDRVRQLILLAPAGLGHDLGPVARLVVNHPWLGTWLFFAFYARSYGNALEAERGLPGRVEGMVDRQKAELEYRGFLPGVLRSLRGILDDDQAGHHRDIAAAKLPVLAVWGAEDDVIPLAGKDKLAACNPRARQAVIEGAGHALAYTHPGAVLEAFGPVLPARV
ncbi:alpha/beta fold hydrolase [Roseovarius sp. SYSU LYC5161]|uniref:alpha/beta fold hydrolase n=1 Tax=Roseovarius halophilus (ex Wu et al. 2025) TaxID=3376060 RepID=UPI0028728C5D|nr:alpha/beta hydrolase [Roseovarius sp.]